MNVLKKITATIFAGVTALTMMSAVSASATDYTEASPLYNPNTTDTVWYAGNDYCRRKFTDSSLYVKNSSMYHSVTLNVWGRKTKYGNDEGVGGSVTVLNLTLPANSVREVRQNINENNCLYAHIYFVGSGASGVWSPDCAGSYQKLN